MIKVRCPICQREMQGEKADWPQFPFCSPRCKTIDLGRWLSGNSYGVPARPGEEEAGASSDESEAP
jgi:endogenous inhibitor of DNA gyrase (YacG/DUF329 family)